MNFLLLIFGPLVCNSQCTQPLSCTKAVSTSIWQQSSSSSCDEKYSVAVHEASNATYGCNVTAAVENRLLYLLPEWVSCYDNIFNVSINGGLKICKLTSAPTPSPTRAVDPVFSISNLPFSTLPTLVVHTSGSEIPTRANVSAAEAVYIPSILYIFNHSEAMASESYNIGIKLHGQSSATEFPKNAYAIETSAEEHVLNLPKHNKWILKGPYSDMSLMRDSVAFDISRAMGEYASRTVHVEFYLVEDVASLVNYSKHFKGVYVLEEKVERSKHRVDIKKADPSKSPEEIGFILKVDKMDKGDNRFILNSTQTLGTNITIVYPSLAKITRNQTIYITEHIKSFEKLLFSRKWLVNNYRSWINRSSFVNYFLLTELVRSADSYWVSTYFSLAGGPNAPLRMGPAWDYDLSMGNTGDVVDPPPCTDPGCPECEACLTDGWQYDVLLQHGKRPHGLSPWFNRLLADSEFRAAVVDRWSSLRATVLSDDVLNSTITYYQEKLNEGAQQRNFVKWPTLGTRVWPYPNEKHQPTYDLEVGVFRAWLLARAQWMDVNMKRYLPHDEFYGPGSSCDNTNHCGAGTVGLDATLTSCSAATSRPNSWNYYGNGQYSQCPAKFNALANSWTSNQAYLSTGGNGSTCSLQDFLFFKDNSCPSPVHCFPATSDYPIVSCQSPGWVPPPPSMSPSLSPTKAPTTSAAPTTSSPTASAPTRHGETRGPTLSPATHSPSSPAPHFSPSTQHLSDNLASEDPSSVIVGLSVGAVVFVFILLLGYFLCRKQAKRPEMRRDHNLSMNLMDEHSPQTEDSYDSDAEDVSRDRRRS